MTDPHVDLGEALPNSGPEPEPESPVRRRNAVLLAATGVIGVAGLGMALIYGPTLWSILREKDATLSTPVEVGGLKLDESAQASETADYLRTALAARLPLDDTVGAVYSDAASTRSVIIVGGTATLRSPSAELDRAFELLSESETGLDGIRSVDAGELGGTMKCGSTPGPDSALVMCGWADHGSVAVAMFPGRTLDESAQLLRALRGQMQHRD